MREGKSAGRWLLLLMSIIGLVSLSSPAWAGETEEGNSPSSIAEVAQLAHSVITAQIEQYYDHYFYYYTAEEYQMMIEDYEGSFGGVGISMTNNEDGNAEVVTVIDDTPAAQTGIDVGDVIETVDGENALGWTTDLIASKIRGELGTSVTIGFRRESGEYYEVTLTRETIVSPSVEGEILEELPHTAYISLYDFTEQTPDEFKALFDELAAECGGIENLVIDLRSNGGGSFWASLNIANFFVPENQLLVREKTKDGSVPYRSVNGELSEVKLALLVNEYSASASEVLAGALRDEAGAVLIGTRTFGKGITQAMVLLSSGSGLRYTNGRYYTPADVDLHGVGLAADIEIPLTETETYETYWSTDPTVSKHIQAALDYFAQ